MRKGNASLRVLVIVLTTSAGNSLGGPLYTITDVGGLGGYFSGATDINSSGQVVGTAFDAKTGFARAFLWTPSSGIRELGSLGSRQSGATSINDAGEVVGCTDMSNGKQHAFTWTASGGMQDLGTFGGDGSQAYAVNNSGQIVGFANMGGGFRWTPGGITDRFMLVPSALNSSGQVAGDFGGHAFLWTSGVGTRDIGFLPGGSVSYSEGINDSGQIVGYAWNSSKACRAFLWSASDGMADLGTLGGTNSIAYGVNNLCQVVGYGDPVGNTGYQAFIWSPGGGMRDLNDLIDPSSGWMLKQATAINDLGQIVGEGYNAAGQDHAFLLTPIPEPATLSLLLLGGLVVLRKRRK